MRPSVIVTLSASLAAAPLAVKVTVPVTPTALAVTVSVPGVASSVQPPSVAMPFWSVLCVAPLSVPLPDAAANVTATPATGWPPASVTLTDGSAPASGWPAVPLNVVAPLAAMACASPLTTCSVPLALPV
jgi:hypothetical protein